MGGISGANMVRILAIQGYESYFGAERANIQVLSMLRRLGAEIIVLGSSNADSDYQESLNDLSVAAEFIRWGPTLFGIQWNLSRYFRNFAGMVRVSRAVVRLADKYNITHIYIPNYVQFLYVFFALKSISGKIVVFRLGDPPEPKEKLLHRVLWRYVINPCVDVFIANSCFTAARLVTHGVSIDKVKVIGNTVTRKIQQSDIGSRSEISVLYVGQMNKEKGVLEAVRAATILCGTYPSIRFDFVGRVSSDPVFWQTLIGIVDAAKLSDRITFHGFQSDVGKYYRSSDIHICPSLQCESSANVVVEAKNAGLPSIVFPRGGLPELVEHTVDGWICNDVTVESLVAGIRYFADDLAVLKTAGKAALASAKRFVPEKISSEWELIFCID